MKRRGMLNSGRFDEVNGRLDRVESEVGALRNEIARFLNSADREQDGFRQSVEAAIERKHIVHTNVMKNRFDELERRIAELEAAERRRKAGEGA